VIAQQLGLGFVTAVDPTQGQQGVLIGNFLSILGMTLLFATDTHHLVISALNESYRIFAPGELMPSGDVAALATAPLPPRSRSACSFRRRSWCSAWSSISGSGTGAADAADAGLFRRRATVDSAGFLIFALVIVTMMGTFLEYFIGVMHQLIPQR
jgi:flagellar biosynthetic protein FliR